MYNKMENINLILTCVALSSLVACGGGGGGDGVAAPTATFVTLTVNNDGMYKTAPYANSTNYVKNSSTGFFVSPYVTFEWSGAGLGYTDGYVNPTSGNLYSYRVSNSSGTEMWYSISGLNFNLSSVVPSIDASTLAVDALFSANATKIYGGSGNDKTFFLQSTSEVDLSSGSDTLVLSQNFNVYKFSKVAGSVTSVNVSRDGSLTLVKNVEFFQFADGTRSLASIISTLP